MSRSGPWDSRVVLLLGMKYLLLKEILSLPGTAYWLVMLPLASRWAASVLSCFFPYARREGLGQAWFPARDKGISCGFIFKPGAALVIGGLKGSVCWRLLTSGLLGGWYSSRIQGITGMLSGRFIESGSLGDALYRQSPGQTD